MANRTGGQILVDQLLIHGATDAFCVPGEALVAPGPRVTKQMPGLPVSLPAASAIMQAPPSARQMVTFIEASCSASSTAR